MVKDNLFHELCFMILFLYASFVSASCAEVCSIEEQKAADSEAAYLHDWKSLYNSFTKYKHCDDGAIAEGYSVSISKLLIESWIQLERVNSYIEEDKLFEDWILHHIDETIPIIDIENIRENASHECPKKLNDFCQKILKNSDY